MLAGGEGGGCLDSFLLSIVSLQFSLSHGDGPIYTEILSQRAVKSKTSKQATPLLPLLCCLVIRGSTGGFCFAPVFVSCSFSRISRLAVQLLIYFAFCFVA